MFATLNYSGRENGKITVERIHEPATGLTIGHQRVACNHCHIKKIKCDGQRPSCGRCLQKKITCAYSSTTGRKRQRTTPEAAPVVTPPPSRDASRQDSPTSTQNGHSTEPQTQPSRFHDPAQMEITTLQTPQSITNPATHEYGNPSASDIQPPGRLISENLSTSDSCNILPTYPRQLFPDAGEADGNILDAPFGSPTDFLNCFNSSTSEEAAGTESFEDNPKSSMSMAELQSFPTGLDLDLGIDVSEQFPLNVGADGILSQVDALVLSQQRQRFDDVLASSHPDSTSTTGSACDCLGQAAVLLEKWEGWKHKTEIEGIVGLLASQKHTVSVCNAIFDCKRCGKVSSSMMLPLTICRHLVNFFQSIASGNLGLDGPYQWKVASESRVHTNKDTSDSPPFSLGNYHIDSVHEWRHVVGVLVLFQWKELQKLLRRSKMLASSAHWETQLLIIESLEDRLRDFATKSQQAGHNIKS